jgi:molecular chaperone DnaK (HSP70)
MLISVRWKLHLCAKDLASSHIREDDIPPLPQGKSAVQVLADFMRYLFECARIYIQESHVNLWRSVENSIEFVLTHPNGWEGPQQQQIRRAAELAGLISCKEEQSHVHLLTEGEASLYFCVTNTTTSRAFSSPIAVSDFPVEEGVQSGSQGILIVDAGGRTIDLSVYSMKLSPTSFEEIAPAECRSYFSGSFPCLSALRLPARISLCYSSRS